MFEHDALLARHGRRRLPARRDPYLIEREGTNNENLPETHEVLKRCAPRSTRSYPNRMLLAEANQWPEDVREYFGDGDECHMAFHFPLMPRMFMAIAQEDRYPIVEIMQQTPEIPDNCQWAIFLRNHDELTLEMVTDEERDYMYRMYAADPRARINLGIRRRLAPLMENDRGKIELMNSLLLSMPGHADHLLRRRDRHGRQHLPRRPQRRAHADAVEPDRNAGFSRADPQRLYLPPIMDPVYGYQAVNVEAQARDPSSLLNWMKRMLAVRKRAAQAFGRGRSSSCSPATARCSPICASTRRRGDPVRGQPVARSAQPVELDLARFKGRVPVELLGRTPFPPIGELPYLLTLPAHGFYWFRLATDASRPAGTKSARRARTCRCWCCSTAGPASSASAWCPGASAWPRRCARSSRPRAAAALPRAAQRWYAAKGEPIARVARIITDGGLGRRALELAAHAARGRDAAGEPATYFLPLALAWEDTTRSASRALGAARSPRCASRPTSACWPTRSPTSASAARSGASAIGGRAARRPARRDPFTPTGAFRELAGADAAGAAAAGPPRRRAATRSCASATASSSRAIAAARRA